MIEKADKQGVYGLSKCFFELLFDGFGTATIVTVIAQGDLRELPYKDDYEKNGFFHLGQLDPSFYDAVNRFFNE